MWEQIDQILRRAMAQISDHVANFLPGVLVTVILMLVAFVVALLVRMLLVRALRGLELDRRADQFGLAALFAGWPSAASPSEAIARIVYWMILILGLLVSFTALNATIPSQLALSVFEYVPHLLAAVLILIAGAIAARFLARSVLIGAVNLQLQSARLLGLSVKWLVLLVAVAMALDHLGIGRRILVLAFGILFGGVVLAAALAVGLGAKDAVGRMLEQQLREPPRGDRNVDHV
jgi:hypothetical protein